MICKQYNHREQVTLSKRFATGLFCDENYLMSSNEARQLITTPVMHVMCKVTHCLALANPHITLLTSIYIDTSVLASK